MTRADLTHRIRSRPAPWAFGLGLLIGLAGALAAGASAPVVVMVALMGAVVLEAPFHGVTLYPVTDYPPRDRGEMRAAWAAPAGFVPTGSDGVIPRGLLLAPRPRRSEVTRAYAGLIMGRPTWVCDLVIRDRRGRTHVTFSYVRVSLPVDLPAFRIEPRWVRPGIRDRRADILRRARSRDPLAQAWRAIPGRGTDPREVRGLITPALGDLLTGMHGLSCALGIELRGTSAVICFPPETSPAQLARRVRACADLLRAMGLA